MAMQPPRLCPSCLRLVVGACTSCQQQRVAARPSARERGYTRAWDAYSRRWLAKYPYCGMRLDGQFHREHSLCAQRGQRVPATVTDHIVSLAQGGSLWDRTNHQSLCVRCNTRKG